MGNKTINVGVVEAGRITRVQPRLKKLAGNIDVLGQKLASFFPWCYQWRVGHVIQGSVLDIGCGTCQSWRLFVYNENRVCFAVALDCWRGAVETAKNSGLYTGAVLADANFLPFRDKCFDNVLLLQVLEHLKKEDGIRLLGEAERIAKKRIIVGVPAGDSSWQWDHLSRWDAGEFREWGYKVRGHGVRCPFSRIIKHDASRVISKHIPRISCLFPLPSYYLPQVAYQIVAVKTLGKAESSYGYPEFRAVR